MASFTPQTLSTGGKPCSTSPPPILSHTCNWYKPVCNRKVWEAPNTHTAPHDLSALNHTNNTQKQDKKLSLSVFSKTRENVVFLRNVVFLSCFVYWIASTVFWQKNDVFWRKIHETSCFSLYWIGLRSNISKLFIKQKQCIRAITKSNFRAHTAPLFKKLKILPLPELIKYSQLKFMHNFNFNKLPFSFQEMWISNRMRNPLVHLRNSDDLYIVPHRLETLKRLPLFSFPMLWNNEENSKLNPICFQYLKCLKSRLLSNLT